MRSDYSLLGWVAVLRTGCLEKRENNLKQVEKVIEGGPVVGDLRKTWSRARSELKLSLLKVPETSTTRCYLGVRERLCGLRKAVCPTCGDFVEMWTSFPRTSDALNGCQILKQVLSGRGGMEKLAKKQFNGPGMLYCSTSILRMTHGKTFPLSAIVWQRPLIQTTPDSHSGIR